MMISCWWLLQFCRNKSRFHIETVNFYCDLLKLCTFSGILQFTQVCIVEFLPSTLSVSIAQRSSAKIDIARGTLLESRRSSIRQGLVREVLIPRGVHALLEPPGALLCGLVQFGHLGNAQKWAPGSKSKCNQKSSLRVYCRILWNTKVITSNY